MEHVIEKARTLATAAHEGQTRWDEKVPYITHPEAVADAVETPEEKATAWLHDVVEDTKVTQKEIDDQFPLDIAVAVDAMTKRGGERYLDYIIRVKSNPIARKVKIADIQHNSSTMRKKGSMYEKYMLALYILSDGAIH